MPDDLAAVVLIGGLQEKGLIGGGGFVINKDFALNGLLTADVSLLTDRHQWVITAMTMMKFKGEVRPEGQPGFKHNGIQDDDDMVLTALLYDEADLLEIEIGRVKS